MASALGVVIVGIAFAALATCLTAPGDERPSVAEAAASEGSGARERRIDWDALPAEVVAWVEVPGTSIDEPIAQASASAPNAYLYKDAFGQGAYGTPYIDCECSLDAPFVMVYGHHMSDGSVFADFANFIDESFAREHSEIILYQREGETLHLTPIAVDIVNASAERLNIQGAVDRIGESDLVLDSETEACDQVFAFATCSYQTGNSRTVLYASH